MIFIRWLSENAAADSLYLLVNTAYVLMIYDTVAWYQNALLCSVCILICVCFPGVSELQQCFSSEDVGC